MVQKISVSFAIASMMFLLSRCTKNNSGGGATSSFKYAGAPVVEPYLTPAPVIFTNTSTNATGYFWNFGDGTNSTAANPTHSYFGWGSYTVSLTAFSSGGATTSYQTVNLYEGLVSIKEISITKLPLLQSNGTSWNYPATGGPNVYVNIVDGFGDIFWNGSDSVKQDVTTAKLPLSWSSTYVGNAPAIQQKRYLAIYNTDSTNVTSIDSLPFLWSNYLTQPNAFPSTISLTDSVKGVSATLSLKWQ